MFVLVVVVGYALDGTTVGVNRGVPVDDGVK